MHKLIKIIVIIISLISTHNVNAANYELKELIPAGIKTTIVTKNFSYRQFYYNKTDNKIYFTNIKNISDKEIPLSFSIGMFDSHKKNVGVMHYCEKSNNLLLPDTEIPLSIEITPEYIGSKKTKKDIKYIALLEDNYTCKTDKSQIYVGQKVQDIGNYYGGEITNNIKLTLQVITIIVTLLITLFLYQYLFTNKYKNIDGNEVREVLKNFKNDSAKANTFGENKEISDITDELTIINKSKSIEMADAEKQENEKSERKESDLYDMYK